LLLAQPSQDHWKLIYARILYQWEMDAKAVELLKCVQDPDLRRLYNELQCQPTVPKHDNLPRVGISVGLTTAGAPWLSCSWCHEYVHGRALICHACGHGGHQQHMIKWFRIAKKQLLKIGLAPVNYSRFGSNCSNSSSCSNFGTLAAAAAAKSPRSSRPPPLPVLTNGVCSPELPPLANSVMPPMLPELIVTSPTLENAENALLLDMQTLPPLLVSPQSRRGSKPTTILDELTDEDEDDDDDDSDDDEEEEEDGDVQDWDSSDVDSDDHLHAAQLSPKTPAVATATTTAAVAVLGDTRRQKRRRQSLSRRSPLSSPQQILEEEFALQLEIPTCPTGCGCNCVYESRRLIIQNTGGCNLVIASHKTTGIPSSWEDEVIPKGHTALFSNPVSSSDRSDNLKLKFLRATPPLTKSVKAPVSIVCVYWTKT
ncbi:GATOR complex protein wdr59, partial [Coemansia aciculifera]